MQYSDDSASNVPAAAGRRRAPKWEEDGENDREVLKNLPTMPIDKQCQMYLDGIDVPIKVQEMLHDFAVDDEGVNESWDQSHTLTKDVIHVAMAKSKSPMGQWFIDEHLLRRSMGAWNVPLSAGSSKPASANFSFLLSSKWHEKEFARNKALYDALRKEIFDSWDQLVADGFIRVDQLGEVIQGSFAVAAKEGSKSEPVPHISPESEVAAPISGEWSGELSMARLNRELFAPTYLWGSDDNMLETMRNRELITHPTLAQLRRAYLEGGGEGSGQLVAMPLKAVRAYAVDFARKSRHNSSVKTP